MGKKKVASSGKCTLCGSVLDKAAMTKHLAACREKNDAMASGVRPGPATAFHVLVEGRYQPEYWMHLEVPSRASLEVLDGFLRDVWLECCGHLSAFRIEGITYSAEPMDDFEDEMMNIALSEVLRPGLKFHHEYDFGSTTHLVGKVIAERETRLKGKGIRLLARNEPPVIPCGKCGQPAEQVCAGCAYEASGWLCKACARQHACGADMFLPVVNSPRVGVCGYTG
ncbi:MAG: hypothetical protein JW993_17595 [Sedimentisphaerales bacterium]|nr:hypothetical protein [Sedimentisphaerales bacterium]